MNKTKPSGQTITLDKHEIVIDRESMIDAWQAVRAYLMRVDSLLTDCQEKEEVAQHVEEALEQLAEGRHE